ncbi:MAG: hypothetical protein AABY18_03715 [Candidatus Thermoplasmatota archaeon]
MISLPKPLSARSQNTGMPQRRRKSGLRTAAGSLQEQFLDRMQALADDPTVVLARSVGPEPRPLAKLRRGLEALKAGRTPLAARFDAHVLGATYRAMKLAEWEAVPRLMDAKIAGQRRFYIQRGQVVRACSLGVQNFDHPRVLLLAYASMAQRHKLHFFALPDGVVCTGKAATPPPEWFSNVGGENVALAPEGEGAYGCGHRDRDRVLLGLQDGPSLAVCGPCGQRAEGMHRRLRERYIGPQQKKPVTLHVQKADGGAVAEPPREAMARYRAGIATEADVIRSAA